MVVFGLVLLAVAGATDHLGSDLGGADLIVADGDTLTGAFVGVGRFEVPLNATVVATDLVVEAREIVVEGVLSADGTGYPGGQFPGSGQGPGGGAAPVDDGYGSAGGGGGGHGGPGGDSGPGSAGIGASGGTTNGDSALPTPEPGSGGGPGSQILTDGAAGGGSLVLRATSSIELGPTARAGADGDAGDNETYTSAGGGGAGGSVRIEAPTLILWGDLTARGGRGGDGGSYWLAGGGGGGGAGGRIFVQGTMVGAPRIGLEGGDGGLAGVWLGRPLPPGLGGGDGTYTFVEGPPPTDCDDADLDGVCDEMDACFGDDTSGDTDLDGWCRVDVIGGVVDCDDLDPERYRGAPERCNGLDDACVGRLPADESDLDGDGLSICAGDCDDLDLAIGPDAAEACGNLADDDCDGSVDEDCPIAAPEVCGCTAEPRSFRALPWAAWFVLAHLGLVVSRRRRGGRPGPPASPAGPMADGRISRSRFP